MQMGRWLEWLEQRRACAIESRPDRLAQGFRDHPHHVLDLVVLKRRTDWQREALGGVALAAGQGVVGA